MIENAEKTALANAWIKRSLISRDLGHGDNTDEYFWAFKELERLVHDDPISALEIIILIVSMKPEESVLYHLAAGPLEALLVRHGDKVITSIEKEASRSTDFRWLIGGIWESGIAPDIWTRLQKVAD